MPTVEQAREWYSADDPVHGFDHVLRVMRSAEEIGEELGADLEVLRAAALLHDAAGADPRENRSEHENASAEFAQKLLGDEGWPERARSCSYRVHCEPPLPRQAEAEVTGSQNSLRRRQT